MYSSLFIDFLVMLLFTKSAAKRGIPFCVPEVIFLSQNSNFMIICAHLYLNLPYVRNKNLWEILMRQMLTFSYYFCTEGQVISGNRMFLRELKCDVTYLVQLKTNFGKQNLTARELGRFSVLSVIFSKLG